MIRRWIIRSFFIGLLLLCVGGWLSSYYCPIEGVYHKTCTLACWTSNGYLWVGYSNPGNDYGTFVRVYRPVKLPGGKDLDAIMYYRIHHSLGFAYGEQPSPYHSQIFCIPFWFPTVMFAGFICLVWRKTRPKSGGRAFPVELANPIAE